MDKGEPSEMNEGKGVLSRLKGKGVVPLVKEVKEICDVSSTLWIYSTTAE